MYVALVLGDCLHRGNSAVQCTDIHGDFEIFIWEKISRDLILCIP